jgi:sec-independent protein translocase protein TatA
MNNVFLGLIGPIGGPEMIMIFIVILLLFGAKKLPELARGVGKSMGEFKKARDEFEREITRSEDEVRRDDRDKARAREEKETAAKVKPAADNHSRDA